MSVWLPPHHVLRPRLAAPLTSARLALVEAGAGYGKSTLAAEAAADLGAAFAVAALEPRDVDPAMFVVRLERALRRAGLSDLATLLAENRADPEDAIETLADGLAARTDSVVIAVDDAHHAEGDSAALVARLASSVGPPHRVWILGRRLPAGAEALRNAPGVARLDAGDLSFTPEEAAALCRSLLGVDGPAEALLRTTGGWVAALVLGALASARGEDASDGVRGDAGQALRDLVRRALAGLAPEDCEAMLAVARLPLFSPDVADAATGRPGLLERASAAGLPLARGPAGWWELPGPVTDLMASMTSPDGPTARRAAPAFLAAGEPAAAVDALLAAGQDIEAAHIIAGLSAEALERLDDLELMTAVAALSTEAVEQVPTVLLHLARACETRSHIERRTEALDRAHQIAVRIGDGVLAREVAAERARDLVRDGLPDEAERAARELLAAAGPDEIATRARAALVLGTTMVRHGVRTADAEPVLDEAHRLAMAVGRREWAVQAWALLALGVDMVLGRTARAIERIDRAVALLPARSGQRAVILTFRAEALNELGRYDEARASLTEARRLAADLRLPRAMAYAAWEGARTASQTGDRDAVIALVRETEDSRGEWFDKETGAIFLAETADLLDRVGAVEEAHVQLARAVERRADSPFLVLLAEGAIAARSGDPHAAEALLLHAQAHPRCALREEWRITLLRAHAARRRGDPDAAGLAAQSMRQATELGNPDLPLIRERVIAEGLLDLAREGGGEPPAPENLAMRVRTLGAFAVMRGSAELRLPPGRPDLLVKFLVARDGKVHAEEAIEALWPDVEPVSGRKRLRNTLSRLRAVAGDLVVRHGEMLTLEGAAEVDALEFSREARQVLAMPDSHERAAQARAAIARYGGDLLPHEPYEPWVAAPRERLRGRYLALLDLLVVDADTRGDVDDAIRLLERGAEVDPFDDERSLKVARLLLSHGRRGAALAAIRRAQATLVDLGLPISVALDTLRNELAE